MSKTPVILVLVTNKQGRVLEHSQFFRVFSVFGTIQKILIFERKIIWKVFIEYDTPEAAQKSLNLDGTLFENLLKMRVHLSQRESLTFQPNNNCGVDYSALSSKQQFFIQLKEDSNSLNSQLQQNLANINMLMCQLAKLQTQNSSPTDMSQYQSIVNQIIEYRNQAQQLTVLYQQQLRNYASVLHREGRRQAQQNTSYSLLSASPSPIKEEANEHHETSSSEDEFRHSDAESLEDTEQDEDQVKIEKIEEINDENEQDNYDDVFECKNKLMSYNSPSKDFNSPFATTATPSPYLNQASHGSYAQTPIPRFFQKTFIMVQHPITNLRVIYNIFSTFVKIEFMFSSPMGPVFQLGSMEEATYLKELLHNKPLLGVPMNLILSIQPCENLQNISLPLLDRKPTLQKLSNTLLVSGLQNVSKEQLIQYFGYMTPIQNLKFLNSSQCKIQYQDIGCSLTILGHFQDMKINGRSLQLSFSAF